MSIYSDPNISEINIDIRAVGTVASVWLRKPESTTFYMLPAEVSALMEGDANFKWSDPMINQADACGEPPAVQTVLLLRDPNETEVKFNSDDQRLILALLSPK